MAKAKYHCLQMHGDVQLFTSPKKRISVHLCNGNHPISVAGIHFLKKMQKKGKPPKRFSPLITRNDNPPEFAVGSRANKPVNTTKLA
jgi:hypothetical protein